MHASWQPPGPLEVPTLGSKPAAPFALGQVSGVAKGHNSDIWVFQRGDVVWDAQSFRADGQHIADPTAFVQAPAVVQLDQVWHQHFCWGCCCPSSCVALRLVSQLASGAALLIVCHWMAVHSHLVIESAFAAYVAAFIFS